VLSPALNWAICVEYPGYFGYLDFPDCSADNENIEKRQPDGWAGMSGGLPQTTASFSGLEQRRYPWGDG